MIERKVCQFLEIKAGADGSLKGYATTYEDPENADSYGDIVAPGAFNDSIAGIKTLPMMNSHDNPIGKWHTFQDDPTGSLHERKGLWVEGKISAIPEGQTVQTLIDDEVIRGLSIGFQTLESSDVLDHKDQWGWPVRRIIRGELLEISPTAIPANRNAEIMEARDRKSARLSSPPPVPCGCHKSGQREEKGTSLIAALDAAIDQEVDDETPRSEIIAAMGDAAGISSSAVDQILNGGIDCPPLPRLEAFGRFLDGTSLSALISAAESDGCDPTGSNDEEASIAEDIDTITSGLTAAISRARALH